MCLRRCSAKRGAIHPRGYRSGLEIQNTRTRFPLTAAEPQRSGAFAS
jgi:hypothetical protein